MIEVENLTYTYTKADKPAVLGLNFAIEKGEIFGFLGPSGAGKSTAQKILIGLLKDYQGTISIFDKNLSHWNSDFYEGVGVAFEFPNHYLKLTAIENLTYFSSLYNSKTQSPQALLNLVGLNNDGEMLVSQYSKGMKTRLGVARSLLNTPELLFMDEPTVGLDPVNARRIRNLIKAQKQEGRTIFLTTHDMVTADELCDRVAFIDDGEIKVIDSPRNLKLLHGEPKVRIEFKDNDQTERREFPLKDLGNNGAFLELLREHNIQTIHTLEATLEDVFILATGRSLS
ncbi:MAG: ABC transporter ATP-binding protein [bacterium]